MDLSKASGAEKLNICRKYTIGGAFLLPFLWLTNFAWFFREAFLAPQYPEQAQIRRYVIISGVGSAVWTVALATWFVVYQVYRPQWGELGDRLSFSLPKGTL